MPSYFDRIFKPCFNQLLNNIPGKKGPLPYFRLLYNLCKPNPATYPDVVAVVTTKCSLKCKNCNNLMPCYQHPYDVPAEEVIRDLNRLLLGVDLIVKLSLIGGEPFLYPDLIRVLDAVADNPKVMYVSLTTNGTILPKEDLIQKLRNPKVIVQISDYGVKTQKIPELIRILEENGIKYVPDKVKVWVSPGGTENRGKSREQLSKEYLSCFSSKYCRTLLRGKFYLCARGAHLYDLGYMKETHDLYDIRKKQSRRDFRRTLRDYMLSDYAEACNYCDHAKKITVKPGEQVGE